MMASNHNSENSASEKNESERKANVLVEAALVVRIPTGDPSVEVKDVLIEDLLDDSVELSKITDAINSSEKLDEIVEMFIALGKYITHKFPEAKILASRDLHFQQPKEVNYV